MVGQFLMSVDGGGGGGGAGEALVLITRSRAPGLALLSTNTLTLPHLHSPLIIFLPPTPGHSGSYSDFRMTTRKEVDSGWTVDSGHTDFRKVKIPYLCWDGHGMRLDLSDGAGQQSRRDKMFSNWKILGSVQVKYSRSEISKLDVQGHKS